MDTAFRTLLRQYAVNGDDNELAHKIARMAARTTGPSEAKSFEEEIKDYQEFLDANQKALGDKIGTSLQALLAKHPEIEAIQWAQYAPYFNDGEPCEFGVNDVGFKFTSENSDVGSTDEDEGESDEDEDESSEDEDDGDFEGSWNLDDDHPAKKAVKSIEEVFSSIPEDLMKHAFGEDNQITISKKGIKVSDYSGSHD